MPLGARLDVFHIRSQLVPERNLIRDFDSKTEL
jgi:hypothetical protein